MTGSGAGAGVAGPALGPGLAEPAFATQALFRIALEAMARPGTIHPLTVAVAPPAPLLPWAGAVALTLLDLDTPVWLDPTLDCQAVRDWLRFHAGSLLVDAPGAAAFALVGDPAALDDLSAFAIGSAEYPDRGATVIIQVAGLSTGVGWILTGPGIQGRTRLRAGGLSADFARAWAENAALYPQGVDVFLAAPDGLAALPRSVTVSED